MHQKSPCLVKSKRGAIQFCLPQLACLHARVMNADMISEPPSLAGPQMVISGQIACARSLGKAKRA